MNLTQEQKEVVELHKNLYGTKEWFFFTTFDVREVEKEFFDDADFYFCIQNQPGGDVSDGFEAFLPEKLVGDIVELSETMAIYKGDLPKESVIKELNDSLFFTELKD